MWLIWLRFMWKFISSVESMVVLSLVIFEKMSSNQVSKYRFWQEKYYYLSTLNLLQNRNPNASLPIHSFLLNLKQFYRLYLWSLFVFLFVWVFWEEERMLVVFFSCLFGLSWVVFFFFFSIYWLKCIWDYFWHHYSGSWNNMFWHLLASLAICLFQAVILVLLLGMHLTIILQVYWDLEFCKQWKREEHEKAAQGFKCFRSIDFVF